MGYRWCVVITVGVLNTTNKKRGVCMEGLHLRQPRNTIEVAMMDFAKRISTDTRTDEKPEWMPDDIYLGATKYDAIIMVS